MSVGFSWGCSSARCIPPHPGARCCGGCGAMSYFYIPQEDVENICLMVVYDGLMMVYEGVMLGVMVDFYLEGAQMWDAIFKEDWYL